MWWATTAACGNRTQTSLWPYPVRVVAECLSLNELDLATCTAVPAWSQRGKRKTARGGKGADSAGMWPGIEVVRWGSIDQQEGSEDQLMKTADWTEWSMYLITLDKYYTVDTQWTDCDDILDDWLQTNNVCSHWYCLKIAAVIADEIRDLREFESRLIFC